MSPFYPFLGTNLSHYGGGWSHLRIFRQCGQLRGDIQKLCIFSLQMLQRCCRPWQVSCFLHRANELCKRTGETLGWGSQSTIDSLNHQAETHCKNARVSRFTTPRHLFIDNRSSGFCTAFRTVSSASGWPCKSLRFPFIGWYLTSEGCRETRHPFEIGQNSARLTTVRNAFYVILIIAHIYLISVCEFLLQSCHLVDILK